MAGSSKIRKAVSLMWWHLLLALLKALCYSQVSGSWQSSLPKTIRALKGSCVVIPCSFTYPGSRESLGGPFSVAWYQYRSRGYPEIYNSKGTASVLPEYQSRTQLLGDLELGNCTLSISPVRSEDAMSYYVWINPDSVQHRFYDVTVQVEVADTPEPLMLSDPGALVEGDRTTITCSIRHTCPSAPPSLGWSVREGKAVTRHERLAGGSWRVESVLSYTPSYKDHGRYLQCTATFPSQQQAHNRLQLEVKYRPRGTAVAVVGPTWLKEGDSVTLRCSSQSHPPASSYRWFQGPRRVPLRGLGQGPEVTVPAVGRRSGPYRCAAENEIGLGEDSPAAQLDVEYAPELLPLGNCTVRGSGPGAVTTCYCAAEGNPRPHLEWRLPNRTLPGDFEGPELHATSGAQGLAVSTELRGPAGALANVSCAATNAHGQSQAVLPFVLADAPELLPLGNCTVQGSGPGAVTTCYCAAKGNPRPRLEWRLPNRTLPGDFEGPELQATSWAQGPAVSTELWGPAGALANVSCVATNTHGQSQAVLPIVPTGHHNLWLVISTAAIGGIVLLLVLAIVVYKVARARKNKVEGPSIYSREDSGEQRLSLQAGKPSKAKKEKHCNLYNQTEELEADNCKDMERVQDYENVAARGDRVYGNIGNWQPHLLADQIYSNVEP
ncbi:myelin-associated glycoprotein-like isoform X2 [Carettochelys insculpta]|uniref:myelin-associated glycoprotein-like isoform X2 n=1 Tax=Carettochelys insculpta TaxID=44489 RepID=UPI003EBB7894